MGKGGVGEAGGRLGAVVAEARARLRRAAGRAFLRERWAWAVGAGAAAAMTRPLLWKLGEETPLWQAPERALLLFAAGSALAAGGLLWAGRRRGPSEVGAARALDEALSTPEVMASGLCFARYGRREPLAALATRRAEEAAQAAQPKALFTLPSLRPSLRGTARFAGALLIALAVGSYDPAVATALAAPPSAIEREAAAELEEAAAEIARLEEKKEPKKPGTERSPKAREKGEERLGDPGQKLAEKAREAARAARRGDRKGALEKIEELRSEGAARAARAGDLGKALRKVAEALAPPANEKAGAAGKGGREAQSAAESTRLLAEKLKKPGGEGERGEAQESTERTLERLERAAEEARRAAGQSGSKEASDAAKALSRAAADLKRGDREAAAQALAEAAQRMASMEQAREAARREAEAIAEMLERSGMLERAVQAAMLGREGEGQGEKGEGEGQGKGEGEGKQGGKPGAGGELRAAILARLAAMGAGDPKSFDQPGTGPHIADRQRSKRAALPVEGAIKAPSQVGDGPKAIQAVQGLGRGSEPPKEYREVFPGYSAAAEEGMADERVPAQRRAAVRKYFQAIRPE